MSKGYLQKTKKKFIQEIYPAWKKFCVLQRYKLKLIGNCKGNQQCQH